MPVQTAGAGGADPAERAPDELSLHIDGMTCGACVARVDKALRGVPGVRDAAVNLTTGLASVKGPADPQQLLAAVDRAGYSARVLAGSSASTLRDVAARGAAHEQSVKRRLIVGALAGIPVLLIDLAMPRLMEIHSPQGLHAFETAQLLFATVVMLFTGAAFFSGAWRALRHFSANMDLLVALGAGVAYTYSVILQLLIWSRGPHAFHGLHNEFHAAVTIIVLVTLGKYLEARAKKRAASGVANLATQTAATAARLRPDGTYETIPAEQVAPGDRLQLLAHQAVPVDGEVVEGAGSADLSIITGESVPIEIHPGSTLPGGATLADGRILLRATSTASASAVARILDLVNAAQASKTRIQGLADRVAAIFVPIVLLLAAGNFAGWMLIAGQWEQALLTTIATIVIACPCAMGLATPTAITVAMGAAARLGILFTKASALETAREIRTVLFDKTGTLTEGRPQVADLLVGEGADLAEADLLRLAASVEQFSEHPLAKAIVAAASDRALPLLDPVRFNSIAGGGVKAAFEDGREFLACSRGYAQTHGISIPDNLRIRMDQLAARGESLVLLAQGAQLLGIIGLRDQLRADAAATVRRLKDAGLQVGVLSGDTEGAVRTAFESIPLDFIRAQVRPDEKAAAIATLRQEQPGQSIAFIGDGINDAPALAAADLGIAMSGGADLAKSAGDVLLTGDRLAAIPDTLHLARRTLRIIRQNLFWAFAYNVAAIPLAMAGILSPGIAAGAMILSSLTVVTNALRLRK